MDLLRYPLKIFYGLPREEQEMLQIRAYEENKAWVEKQFDALGTSASWILICDGEVVRSSNNFQDYPEIGELEKLAEDSGVVPFVFERPGIAEEMPSCLVQYPLSFS